MSKHGPGPWCSISPATWPTQSLAPERRPSIHRTDVGAPLLAVGETALVLEELRALREELRHSLAEQQLWLQVVYAEVRAQAAYPSQAHEAAACAKAGEQLARMKQLVAEKLKG